MYGHMKPRKNRATFLTFCRQFTALRYLSLDSTGHAAIKSRAA